MVNYCNCSVHCFGSMLNCSCGWGDRALQECNLSTQRQARALQEACPDSSRKRRAGFSVHALCNHGTMRKTHRSSPLFSKAVCTAPLGSTTLEAQRLLLQLPQEQAPKPNIIFSLVA